jgi:hypothetical protein
MMQFVEPNGTEVCAFADAIEYPDAVDEDGDGLPGLNDGNARWHEGRFE